MPKPTTFAEAVPVIVDLADKQYDLVHGDASTVVETDNGPVPSAAKAVADLNAEYAALDVVSISTTARDQAQAAATTATEQNQSAEQFSAAAQQYANVYDTIALGRAAVADNAYFRVIPGGADGLLRLTLFKRLSATTQQTVDDYVGRQEMRSTPPEVGSLPRQIHRQYNGAPEYLLYDYDPVTFAFRPVRFKAPRASIDLNALAAEVANRLLSGPIGAAFGALGPEVGSGHRWTLDGRTLMTGDTVQGVYPRRFTLPAAAKVDDGNSLPILARIGRGGTAQNASYLVYGKADASGNNQFRSLRISDGFVFALTTTGHNICPVITPDGARVQYFNATTGILMSVPIEGGVAVPCISAADIAAYGDSLTSGFAALPNNYPRQLAAITGLSVYDGGLGGQTPTQISARQGGAPALITLDGNMIPATATAVNVVGMSTRLLSTPSTPVAAQINGSLAGVPGTLYKTNGIYTSPTSYADSYTFVRTTPGDAVACPADTPFIPDDAVANRGKMQILFYGRNDATPATLMPAYASSIAYLSPINKRFLVGTVLTATTEIIGTSTYNYLMTTNATILAAYPNRTIDLHSPPTDAEMAALGYTPTAQDLTDIANGVIPTGMRANEPLHLNGTGYLLWVHRIIAKMATLGWLN